MRNLFMSEKDLEKLPESKEQLEENWHKTNTDGTNNGGNSDKEIAKQRWNEFEKTLKNS
jgi:hypothetical protein